MCVAISTFLAIIGSVHFWGSFSCICIYLHKHVRTIEKPVSIPLHSYTYVICNSNCDTHGVHSALALGTTFFRDHVTAHMKTSFLWPLRAKKKSRLPSKQLLFIVCVPVISVSPKQKPGDVTAPKYHFHVVGHIIVFAYPIILQKEYKPFYKRENWICVLTSRNKNKKNRPTSKKWKYFVVWSS